MFWNWFRKKRIVVDAAGLTDRGLVRADNQDNIFVDPRRRLFCVADGMGGGEAGGVASSIVCERIEMASRSGGDFIARVDALAAAIIESNDLVRAHAAAHGYKHMGTTVAAVIVDELAHHALIAHLGDTRVYRWRNSTLERLTRDHTMADELSRVVVKGVMQAELMGRSHPFAHVLTRAIGVEARARTDWRKIDLKSGDRYLICSDGVVDMLDDERLTAAFGRGGTAADVVETIRERVTKAGAEDNFSAIVFEIGDVK